MISSAKSRSGMVHGLLSLRVFRVVLVEERGATKGTPSFSDIANLIIKSSATINRKGANVSPYSTPACTRKGSDNPLSVLTII